MNPSEDIHPIFSRMLTRAEREARLGQTARVLWLYGLSGSGKSTLAVGLERRLFQEGYLGKVLDGDNLRSGLNSNLTFSDEDRRENIRRAAEVAKLFLQAGIVTINAFITPQEELRRIARDVVGEEDFMEIYVECSLETCEARDVKGLYQKAKIGQIKHFTGKDSLFAAPHSPEFTVNTENAAEEECVERIYRHILPKIRPEEAL